MAHKEMRTVMHGTLVLSLASLIAKILSAIYRVPYQNLVGNEGFYVYQQIYPIYGIAMTLALSGLPQFLSKMVAEQTEEREKLRVLKQLYPAILGISVSCWAFFFFGSHLLAHWMGDSALRSLIQMISFSFLFVPALSFYRGNFQGHLLVVPSAVSQVLEQLVRVGLILFSAFSFQFFGWTVYQTGALAMGGALLGGIVAIGVLRHYDKKILSGNLSSLWKTLRFTLPVGLLRRLIVEGGILSLYTAFLIFFQLIDSFFVKNALVFSGISDVTAKVEKGIYDRGQPLVQLGLIVALALSATFLPVLTSYARQKEAAAFLRAAKIFLRLTTSVAAAAVVGLICLLPDMNHALFKDTQGQSVLSVYMGAVFLMALIQTYQSIEQSQTRFSTSFLAALMGLLVKLSSTFLLVYHLGTLGASLATALGLTVTLALLMWPHRQGMNGFLFERGFLWKLLLCLLVMICGLQGYQWLVGLLPFDPTSRMRALVTALFGVGVGGGIFLSMVLRIQLFTVREWLMFPFGKKILKMKR